MKRTLAISSAVLLCAGAFAAGRPTALSSPSVPSLQAAAEAEQDTINLAVTGMT